jgi:hypothetical protein
MDDDIDLTMEQQTCLLPDRLHNFRMAMPGIGNCDTTSEVQIRDFIFIIDITSLAT